MQSSQLLKASKAEQFVDQSSSSLQRDTPLLHSSASSSIFWSKMRKNFLPMLVSAVVSCCLLLSGSSGATPADPQLEKRLSYTAVSDFKAFEYPVALAGLYANIGPNGAKDGGAASGVVIASPSNSNPDYLYTWIRDASLVYKYIIDRYVSGRDTTLLTGINNFVASMGRIQQVSNPSGTVSSGGLGEPKFLINEAAFTGGWGRPQRDGPALRATAIITFANYLISQSNTTYVRNTLWPILLLDLNYVSNNWNSTGFDLWEEVNGASFFTTAVQHRALRQGIALATALGDTTGVIATWTTQAQNIFCFLQSYWSASSGYIVANVNPGNGAIRSGKDANTVLTSIHTFDPAAGCDSKTFQPCSDKALANLKIYVDAFRSIWSINSAAAAGAAVATGRYPEDSYYGGNPWYLTTFAVSEQLYRAIQVWDSLGQGINITSISLPFFQQFNSAAVVGNLAAGSTAYTTMKTAILNWADAFALVAAKYTPSTGALSEQYSKSDGTPLSASDLTWSYAAVLTMFDARDGVTAESWGAASLTLPSTCSTGSSGGGGGDTGGGTGSTSTVTFKVTATTVWGENIYLTGNIAALTNWSTSSALGPLTNTNTYPVWWVTVTVPAATSFEYKYIRKSSTGAVTWESGSNRVSTSAAAGGSTTLNDTWK
ncbi:carbohydrate-binding module family 20 protein [Serendipita vermifera MAFF 305830]|uniref:Glucoamylase n=1 Tax=Serendipita vermifera MAFF 305830 TaxID=933852 RepID=A0A0C2WVD7_SERVB|nr:carbohydrate-binding module family 20 protein [Serendipita vermifera MAFF 305830]